MSIKSYSTNPDTISVTPATADNNGTVSCKSLKMLRCTAVTSETSLTNECLARNTARGGNFTTDENIEWAKSQHQYAVQSYHSHNDKIRIVYQLFDAQSFIKNPTTLCMDFKRLSKVWGGCHVTMADIELAAFLHPKVIGKYPYYNIRKDFTVPCLTRIKKLGCANTVPYKDPDILEFYKRRECIIQDNQL